MVPARSFLLVDPLDGTWEFLGQSGEFTVNITLVEEGRPVCDVVLALALGCAWRGLAGRGAEAARLPPAGRPRWQPIGVRPVPERGLTVVASRSHLATEGETDAYPRFGPTMEWDTAAGHAVLEAAGGHVGKPGGEPVLYGEAGEGYRNGPFIATGAGPLPSRSGI